MEHSTLRLPDAESICSFYEQTTGMRPDYLQLSAGPGGLTNQVVELDGLTIIWARARGRARWRDQITGPGFQFGCMIESQGPVKILGRDINPDEAAVWLPGQEVDYVLEGPYLSLEIGVSGELAQGRGWTPSGAPLGRVPESIMRNLVKACRNLSSGAGRSGGRDLDGEGRQEEVLILLDAVLDPWHQPGPGRTESKTRFRQLIRSADRFLDALDGEPLDIADLARYTGASRRTLHRAYEDQLGVGPRRYYELKRLGLLRSRLKEADAAEHTITELATALGFHDLGRSAASYRRQYGEYPRATLLRQRF